MKLIRYFLLLGITAIYVIAFCFCLDGCHAQTLSLNQSLQLVTSIPLPKVSGRIDHLAFDGKHQLVFITALGNNIVEVVDLKSKKVIHTIKNLNEPQGIIYVPESNTILVTNGGNGECDVFNAGSFQKITSIKLPGDADNVRYDSTAKRIYVGYGHGGISIIDVTTFKLIGDIKLSGHPESFQIDKTAKRIYVNVPDGHLVEIIDVEKYAVVAQWKMTDAKSNFPMGLDEANHRLFIGCRHPAKLLVMDTQTGKTISSFAIDSDVDDIFYDNTTKQIYLSCGAGYIDIFKQTDANTYTANGKIATQSGARTSLFIPELSQLMVTSPSGFNRDAQLLIFQVK